RHEARLFMTEPPQPYTFERQVDAECGCEVVRARVHRLPSMRMAMVVADAAHNLRTVLDMIAWELARKGNPALTDEDRSVAFPICMAKDDWDGPATRRMVRHIAQDASDRIRSF